MQIHQELRSYKEKGKVPPRRLVLDFLRANRTIPEDIIEFLADLAVGKYGTPRDMAKKPNWDRLREPGKGWKTRAISRINELIADGQTLADAHKTVADEMALDVSIIRNLTAVRFSYVRNG